MPEEIDSTKSLTELFEELSSGEGSKSEGPEDKFTRLSKRERMETCFDLKMRGIPVSAIAKSYGVDPSTVYRLLKEYTEEYRQRIEQEPAANLLADSLAFLDNIETTCLFEASQATDEKEMVVDPTTGLMTPKAGKSKTGKQNKLKFIQTAMKAREMRINLMLETGLVPKEPEKMYLKLKTDDKELEKTGLERSDEEIKNDILKLLTKGRKL